MPKADASASKAARDKRYDKRTKTADFLCLKQENDRLKHENDRLRRKLYDLLQDDPRRQRTFERFHFCGSPATILTAPVTIIGRPGPIATAMGRQVRRTLKSAVAEG